MNLVSIPGFSYARTSMEESKNILYSEHSFVMCSEHVEEQVCISRRPTFFYMGWLTHLCVKHYV